MANLTWYYSWQCVKRGEYLGLTFSATYVQISGCCDVNLHPLLYLFMFTLLRFVLALSTGNARTEAALTLLVMAS